MFYMAGVIFTDRIPYITSGKRRIGAGFCTFFFTLLTVFFPQENLCNANFTEFFVHICIVVVLKLDNGIGFNGFQV